MQRGNLKKYGKKKKIGRKKLNSVYFALVISACTMWY